MQGTLDEFGSIDEVATLIERTSPRGRIYPVDGAGHMFPGRAQEAAAKIAEAAQEMLQTFATSASER